MKFKPKSGPMRDFYVVFFFFVGSSTVSWDIPPVSALYAYVILFRLNKK